MPPWASRLTISGARYIPLDVRRAGRLNLLPRAAAWIRGSQDPLRNEILATLKANLACYAAQA